MGIYEANAALRCAGSERLGCAGGDAPVAGLITPQGGTMGLLGRLSEKRMEDPVEGTAHVVAISTPDPTATSMNYAMDCVVSGPGIEPQAVSHKGVSAPVSKWPSPGETIPITVDRADPTHFVIKWDAMATGHERGVAAAEALAAQMRAGTAGATSAGTAAATQTVSAADVLARGTAGSATLLGSFPADAPGADADHTMIGLMLNVMIDGHPPFQVQNIYKAPTAKLGKLAPGALLPVKADLASEPLVAVDWDAL
jgi:hypothetical protein